MYKKYTTVVALLICVLTVISVNAQDREIYSKEFTHYVFPEFIQGKVKMKTGQVTETLLNYNSLTEEMIFMQKDQPMALDLVQDIDTVYIEKRKFVPVANAFYEVLIDTPTALMLQHKSFIVPPGVETGFGTTQSSAVTSYNDIKAAGMAYKLKLPDDYKVASKTVYWLKKNGSYLPANSAKDIEDAFPEKAKEITDFVKTNKTKFKNVADVIKLVEFCNK